MPSPLSAGSAKTSIAVRPARRVALDKREGSVKDKVILCSAGAPLALPEKVEDQGSGNLTLNHFRWKIVPPTIDSAPTSTMILLCEHPAAGPVRKWKTFFVFQGASFAPSFARALSGMRERPI